MFKKLFSSQLRINMLSGTATTIVNIIVMAVGYPLYLHFLGYEQYGVWLVLTTVLSFASLGTLGIGTAVMKLVAEEHGRGLPETAGHGIRSCGARLQFSPRSRPHCRLGGIVQNAEALPALPQCQRNGPGR